MQWPRPSGSSRQSPGRSLARRYSRKSVLAICSGFWGVWVILAGLSGSFTQFLVLYAIGAAGFAGAGSIALSILGDLYEDARRGRATGLVYGGVAVITGATAPIFGLLSRFEDGWRYGYIITGAICIAIGVLIMLSSTILNPPMRPHRRPPTISAPKQDSGAKGYESYSLSRHSDTYSYNAHSRARTSS
ncbi:MFS transporter [Rhodococcus sp. 3Y1]